MIDGSALETTGIRNTYNSHNKKPVIVLSIILGIVAISFLIYFLSASATISSLNEQVQTLQNENNTLSDRLSFEISEKERISSELSTTITENQNLASQLKTMTNKNAILETNVETLTNTRDMYIFEMVSMQNEIDLYKDTFGSSVTKGISPMANGQTYTLYNNPRATNPTMAQLMSFILSDPTDRYIYVDDHYVCTDYAQDVHNNAERAGIRAGFVKVLFKGEEIGHACNVFKTVDQGLVYIDCTGSTNPYDGPLNYDKKVTVKLNRGYSARSLVDERGWSSIWPSMGIVEDIQIFW